MNIERINELVNRYRHLRIGVVGDFFLTVICTSMPPRPRRRSRQACPYTMSSLFGTSRGPQAPFSTIWSRSMWARSMLSATAATTARVTSCAARFPLCRA